MAFIEHSVSQTFVDGGMVRRGYQLFSLNPTKLEVTLGQVNV